MMVPQSPKRWVAKGNAPELISGDVYHLPLEPEVNHLRRKALTLLYAATSQPSSPALLPSLGEGCQRRDEGCCVFRHVDVV